jgi:hypothetical protein
MKELTEQDLKDISKLKLQIEKCAKAIADIAAPHGCVEMHLDLNAVRTMGSERPVYYPSMEVSLKAEKRL